MLVFILGLVLFFANHLVRVIAPGFRQSLVDSFGLTLWRIGYSIVSLVALALLVYGFDLSRAETGILYNPPAFMSHIVLTLMLVATIIFVSGFLPAGYIRAKTKHPIILSIKIWALAHLLVNGETNSVLLFGAFLAWGVILRISVKRRVAAGEVALPVFKSAIYDLASVVIGVAVYAAIVFRLHEWIIGVAPIVM